MSMSLEYVSLIGQWHNNRIGHHELVGKRVDWCFVFSATPALATMFAGNDRA
jgi:hypothetical protein